MTGGDGGRGGEALGRKWFTPCLTSRRPCSMRRRRSHPVSRGESGVASDRTGGGVGVGGEVSMTTGTTGGNSGVEAGGTRGGCGAGMVSAEPLFPSSRRPFSMRSNRSLAACMEAARSGAASPPWVVEPGQMTKVKGVRRAKRRGMSWRRIGIISRFSRVLFPWHSTRRDRRRESER